MNLDNQFLRAVAKYNEVCDKYSPDMFKPPFRRTCARCMKLCAPLEYYHVFVVKYEEDLAYTEHYNEADKDYYCKNCIRNCLTCFHFVFNHPSDPKKCDACGWQNKEKQE